MQKITWFLILILAGNVYAARPKNRAKATPKIAVKTAPAKPATTIPAKPAEAATSPKPEVAPAPPKPVAPKAPAPKVAPKVETPRARLIRLAGADSLSKLFREVTKQTMPGIVEIRVTKEITLTPENIKKYFRGKVPPPSVASPSTPAPPIKPGSPRTYRINSLGSGSVFDATRGLIITNAHVVSEASTVKVILHDKRVFKADWVRSDPATDLAVIKIRPDRLSAIAFGDSDKMQVGDWVLAFGSPRGLSESVSAGIISAKGRPTRKPGFYAD